MEYQNKDMIESVDKIAEEVLKEKGGKYRDLFFPYLINKLDLKIGVEVGVDKADFSSRLLERTELTRLHCVDLWMDDFGSDCRPGYFDPNGMNRYHQALETLSPFGDRAIAWKMTGVEAASEFENESVDFIYIDGDHSLEGIYCDIKAWLPKLKIGGIISGHDYKNGINSGIPDYFGKQLDYNIKTVVDDYCARYGHALRIVGGLIKSWYFVKNKVTEDHVHSYLIDNPVTEQQIKDIQAQLAQTANDPNLVITSAGVDINDLRKISLPELKTKGE